MGNRKWIAACGLDCESCDIRRLPFDEAAAEICVRWYREMGWLTLEEGVAEALERKLTCNGCKGDRSVHWSVSDDHMCWILECCVDRRGHDFCSQCENFPCDRLTEWSKKNDGYAEAFARLEAMHADESLEGRVARKISSADQTVADFGEQWSRYTDNKGWYGSPELLRDILHPLLDVNSLRGRTVADIGSGTGRIVGMLLNAGVKQVYAVEPSKRAFSVLLSNIQAMERPGDVTAVNAPGDQFAPKEQVEYAFSIGVIHHIPDPLPLVKNTFSALKPGGRFFVWLYGHEGNESYLRVIEPVRRITSRLPHVLLRCLVELSYWGLVCYRAIDKVVTLPLHTYMENVLWSLSPAKRRLMIYDQLNPSFSRYYRKDEAISLLEEAGFRDVQAHHRHGYSWSVVGRKPH
ncbi:methyltransferase domain-containing protein [Candidatus Bipolaricaulota bacterium]|nr:methyltransferase domain-containing protein [Candidatus Bipolaricaulota bacterium]